MDSDSVSPGSNPGSPANKTQRLRASPPSDIPDKVERKAYERRTKTGTVIYFIKSGRYVKIGVSHIMRMRRRISDLQIGNPIRLELLAVLDGEAELESALHSQFRKHRARGEWFYLRDDLASYILRDTVCGEDSIRAFENEYRSELARQSLSRLEASGAFPTLRPIGD